MATAEHWVSVDEVSEHLAVNKDTVYRWIETKNFPAHKAGRLLRFKLSEVDAWVRSDGESQQQKKSMSAKRRAARES